MRAIADRIEGEFGQVEAGRARDARDPMVPTIGEEERALLGAENPRTLAIEMGQPPLAEDNRIFRRDHPRALRARPLWLVHTWMRRRLTSAAGTSSGSSCCEPPRFKEPESYFRRYAGLSDEEAERPGAIWDRINGPNLRENILPTRERAHLVLIKSADHAIDEVWLRKL